MIRSLFAILVLVLFAFSVSAEDLGEVAKKEKARREALAKKGKKSKTFTNADIANIKSELAIQQASPSPASTDAEPAAEESEQGAASTELERLQEQKERLEQEEQQTREDIESSGLYFGTSIGAQYRHVRETEEKLKETKEKIKEEKKEKD